MSNKQFSVYKFCGTLPLPGIESTCKVDDRRLAKVFYSKEVKEHLIFHMAIVNQGWVLQPIFPIVGVP